MPLNNATAAFIGASVTLFLVIVFMILMVILVRQCLAFLAKRNAIRVQTEQQLQARRQFERQRRGSITEPVPATFDWHHSIRIAGTPPPSYVEAKGLPAFDASVAPTTRKKRGRKERNRGGGGGGQHQTDRGHSEIIVTRNRSASATENERLDIGTSSDQRRHTSPRTITSPHGSLPNGNSGLDGNLSTSIEQENEHNAQLMTTELNSSSSVVVVEPPQHTVVELEDANHSDESFQVISNDADGEMVEVNMNT